MNIGELITDWKSDYKWIGGIPNPFIKKEVNISQNPIRIGEVIIYLSVADDTYIVDGQLIPYYKVFQFQTCGQSGTQVERDGDAKRFQNELNDFMALAIKERHEQITILENEGKDVKTTNLFLWK